MEQFNTIPTSGNWSNIAGIIDANFLRCYTALVQSESLVGLSGSNFQGIYTSASALPDDMTEAGWALVGTSLSALQLYVFNEGATDWALFSNDTYNFTDYSSLVSQLSTISSNLGDLNNLNTTDKSSLVAAVNEVKSSAGGIYNLIENNHSSAMSLAQAILHIPTDKYQVGLHIIFNQTDEGIVEYQYIDTTTTNITNADYWQKIPNILADEEPVTSKSYGQETDLDITDENNKVLVRFSGGHIQTKRFDSSKIGTIDFQGAKISILGDSISTFGVDGTTGDSHTKVGDGTDTYLGNHCRYPTSYLTAVTQMWWRKLIDNNGMILGVNESWAGSRVSWDGTTESGDIGADKHIASVTRISHLGGNGAPDYIFVYAGTNDAGAGVTLGTFNTESPINYTEQQIAALPVATFADAFRALLIRLQYYYRTSKVIVMFPNYVTSYYTIGNLDQYVEIEREACDFFGVPYIDLRTSGITIFNRATYLGDGVHPNSSGMELIYKRVLKDVAYKI